MDLESECSALESVEDNEVVPVESLPNIVETKIENNGTYHADDVVDGEKLSAAAGVSSAQSPGGPSWGSPPAATKGKGLRKWRRLRREGNREGNSYSDSGKKRVLPLVRDSVDLKQKSEGFISSTNAIGNAADRSSLYGADSGPVGGPVLADGTDSENSEDRSSKSSTAASAPRPRYEMSPPASFGYHKNGTRGLLNSGMSGQHGDQQQRKGRIESSKKARGDRIKIEKENSHSSMESDSQSSKFVFMQGIHSVMSNGGRTGMPASYDGENSDEAQDGEQHLSEGDRAGFRKNEAEYENVSQEDSAAELSWGMKEEKSENNGSPMDQDVLIESIMTLHSAQEALEKELQKLRDVGKEDTLLFDETNQPAAFPSEITFDESKSSSSHSLEIQMISLKQNIDDLQNKLEEARVMLEQKSIELEATLKSSKSPREETRKTVEVQQENFKDINNDLEELFKRKLEAEIEYLAISRTTEACRAAAIDQIGLLEQQKNLAPEQVQVLNKLEIAEDGSTALKEKAEKLETSCEEIVKTEEVLKLENRVCKFTSCFFIQLVLLVLVLYLFSLKISSPSVRVVPT